MIHKLLKVTLVSDFNNFFLSFFLSLLGGGGNSFHCNPNLMGIFVKLYKAAGEEGAMTPQSTADSSAHVCGFRSLFHCFTRNSHVQIERRRGVAGRGLIWSFHLSGHWESKSKQACGFREESVQYLQAINSVSGCLCWRTVCVFTSCAGAQQMSGRFS